jgi:uncharacterized integral membrane protein
MKVIYTVIIVLVMLFIITFSLENTLPIRLRYYDLMNISLPTYMLFFIAFLVGVIFTGFMGIVERFRLNRTINKLNKTIKELRREVRDSKKEPFIEEELKAPGEQQ